MEAICTKFTFERHGRHPPKRANTIAKFNIMSPKAPQLVSLRTADIFLGWHCAPRLDSARFPFLLWGTPTTLAVSDSISSDIGKATSTNPRVHTWSVLWNTHITPSNRPHPLAPFCGVRAAPRRLTFRTPRSTCFLGTKPLFGGTNATETYQQGSLSQGAKTLETINQVKRWAEHFWFDH